MTLAEIIRHCDEQINLQGENAEVGFRIRGRWTKSGTKRLWPGGPKGEIVNEFPDGTVYAFFNAREVKKAAEKLMQRGAGSR